MNPMEWLLYFRRGRLHKGLDISCDDDSVVYAPFDVELRGRLTVYSNPTTAQQAINKGINLSGEGLFMLLTY